jgi:type I restriction enzyme M protein
MKEFKLEDMMPVKAIEQQIWRMFDVLRGNSIGSQDFHIILLFLSLYKDDQISKDFLFGEGQLNLEDVQHFEDINSKKSANDYSKIIESFSSSLLTIRNRGFKELIDVLFQINKGILKENFSEIFDYTLYRTTQSQGKFGGEFIQPMEITRFICALADLSDNSKVFNPFAGLASFGVFFDQGQDYFGQEVNQKTWALGALRLMAYERPGNSHYVCEDSILNWPEDEKFDLVVANPPYGMQLNQQYHKVESGIRTVEQYLIEKGVNSLNSEGKLIALLPQGFLFRGMHEQRMRVQLIEEDLIDTIISLPGGLLLNTGIPLVVFVINKNKKLPGKVRFVDATKFVETKNPKEKILNDYGLNSVIHKGFQDSEVVRIVDNIQIREYDYNLNVPRYFQKKIEGTKLKDIVEFVRGSRKDIPVAGKMIRIRDLSDDKLYFKLDVSNVEETEFTRPYLRMIDESCLLLATRWKTLKPTYFEFSGDPIFLNPDILSFKINPQVADTAYLINELHADYVEEQIASYRQGATIPMIRRDDLFEIVIKLPSIEEQRAKVAGLLEISEKIKQLQTERNELVHGVITKEFNEFASLKHTLGRPRQNILGWSKNLSKFFVREKDTISALNDEFKALFDLGIIEAIDEINRDIKFISDVLEKGENGLLLNDYEKEIVPLVEINNIINTLSNNEFKFSIKKQLLKVDEMKTRGILINKVLFRTLLDNLLTNANKYGFLEKNKGNHVMIELSEIDDHLIVDVRNNGLPFPKNFDREKFITKYSTADISNGSGLGGYDINRIATYFENENWDLILNTDPIYPIIFRFSFPIKLLK